MAKFLFTELINNWDVFTSRLGAGTGSANNYKDSEVGKFVKQVGDSRYALCAVGDEIQGHVVAVEVATQDGYTIGSVARNKGRKACTADGAQATPGTGTIAIGDYVLCGTVVAKDTALSAPARVVKATDQAAAKSSPFAARVVSLGAAGSGAVGTEILIEFAA